MNKHINKHQGATKRVRHTQELGTSTIYHSTHADLSIGEPSTTAGGLLTYFSFAATYKSPPTNCTQRIILEDLRSKWITRLEKCTNNYTSILVSKFMAAVELDIMIIKGRSG